MLSDLQTRSIHAMINIFETGRAQGDYGQVTLLPGDSGHLTYGRAQTTLGSGNLFLLIEDYCDTEHAALAGPLSAFLARLEDRDLSLDHDTALRALLREAGGDPVMQTVQDAFFERVYWAPALTSAAFIGCQTALGHAVVYDGRIHGSWHMIRDRTTEAHKSLKVIGETKWMERYVSVRRAWLEGHSKPILRKTVYRMDALQELMEGKNWDLVLPFTLRGITISESVLSGPPVRASAAVAEDRLLRLRDPFLRGEDVRAVQEALAAKGHDLEADGVFGPGTRGAVVRFQEAEGLKPDGLVGPATRSRLGLD